MDTSLVVVLVTALLYVAIPGYLLFFRAWPLRAGIAIFFIAQIPLLWQVYFTDSEASGFGILLAVMLPLPLLLIGIGTVAGLVRPVRQRCRENQIHS